MLYLGALVMLSLDRAKAHDLTQAAR